jgi:hypothetical protein
VTKPSVVNTKGSAISPHIADKEAYAAALFSEGFPTEFLMQLANTCLYSCITLVWDHFSIEPDDPAYAFLATVYPLIF